MTTYKIPQDIINDIKRLEDMIDSLRRADVFQYHDWKTDTVHLVSRNFEEPLTDDEKFEIVNHLTMRLFPLKVIFDN